MSASVLSKVGTLLEALSHEGVDKLNDRFAIPVLKQHIRDLEDLDRQMIGESAAATSRAVSARTKVKTTEQTIARYLATAQEYAIDDIESNNQRGTELAQQAVQLKRLLPDMTTNAETEENMASLHEQAHRSLGIKIAALTSKVHQIEVREQTVTAQKRGIATAETLRQIIGSTEGGGLDDIASRQEADAAATNAQFQNAMSGLNNGGGVDDTLDEAQQMMAQFRRDAAAKKTAVAGAGA